jgi:hypothetical protein
VHVCVRVRVCVCVCVILETDAVWPIWLLVYLLCVGCDAIQLQACSSFYFILI